MLKHSSKIRGRALRELRTFLAKNKEFAGHSTRNVEGVLEAGSVLSPLRQYIQGRKVTKMEGYGLVDTNKVRNPLLKLMTYPIQTNALKNLLPHTDLGYGSGGVLFKRPKRYGKNPMAEAFGSSIEMIMRGKVRTPKKSSVFIAPRKDLKRLQKQNPDATIVSRRGFEKQFKPLVSTSIV